MSRTKIEGQGWMKQDLQISTQMNAFWEIHLIMKILHNF